MNYSRFLGAAVAGVVGGDGGASGVSGGRGGDAAIYLRARPECDE